VSLIELVDCLLASNLTTNLTANATGLNISLPSRSGLLDTLNFGTLWQGFATEDEMVAAAMGDDKLFTVFGGVTFHNVSAEGKLPDDLSISIRFHQFKVPSTAELAPPYTWNNAGGTQNSMYYYLGFVLVQDLIEAAVTDFWADERVVEPAVYGQMFPVPAYRDDLFAWGISRVLPLFMVLCKCAIAPVRYQM
jgi:hypothetical protein